MAENYIDKIEVDGVERPIRDTSGSVRYDEAQNLTDEQKAQARGNINAAPGGFGIGETPKYIANANDAVKNGRYSVDSSTLNLPEPMGDTWAYACLDVYTGARPDVYIKQTMTSPYQSWHQCEVTRCFYSPRGGWQPWEWVNPPMILGTEYRTTERYLGKPVYVKTINMGNLPGNAVKQASFQLNNVVDKIVSVTGQCPSDSGVNMSLPYHTGSGPNWNTVILIGATGVGTAQIVTFDEDFAGYTDACITVKYTKLAD